jgi:hypothetical protein
MPWQDTPTNRHDGTRDEQPTRRTLVAMAAPDLHDSFWVAIAAAAPVIGLASAVTAEQTTRRAERNVERAQRRGTKLSGRPRFTYTITYGNIALQTVALALALIAWAPTMTFQANG